MRLSALVCATGVVLAGLANSACAQGLMAPASSYRSATTPTYGPSTYAPSSAPGSCPTPLLPPTTVSPGTTPSTTTPGTTTPGTPPGMATPGTSPAATAPTTSDFSGSEAVGGGAAAAGSSAAASAAPAMIGDSSSRVPLATRGAFKIADNESPRPLDRVFVNFNYFNNLRTSGGPSPDLYRETFGFEKTFLDGNASFGVRVPLIEKDGSAGGSGVDGVGDLSFLAKYAFFNDRQTGDCLSGGLVVTAPTGRDPFPGSTLHSTLLQPWVGFLVNAEQFYVHGFSSLIVPTDVRDATVMFNDIGVGYKAYKACDGAISAIIPTIEAHVTTPFNHRNMADMVHVADGLTFTGGVHIGLFNQAFLTVGCAVPVTGPKPFDFEGIAQLNLRF